MDFFCFMLYNESMKKGLIILIGNFLIFILTGCSLTPAVSTPNGQQQYAFSKSVWITKDGGKTWTNSNKAVNKPTVADINPLSLVFDPKDGNVVYTGLRAGGIIKTANGGESWESLSFKTDKIYGLALDPNDSKIIYASTVVGDRGKIFKNFDSGTGGNWNEIYTAATNGPLVVYLTIDKKNANTIYIATSDNQVAKSADGGVSWKNIFQSKSPVIKISLDAKNSKLIYLLAKSGEIFSSFNNGESFDGLSAKINKTGFAAAGFSVMETDPLNANWIYLAGKPGIIRSKDAGQNWEKVVTLNNPQNSPIGALAINPVNSKEIIYGASQAAYKSIDDGKTWATSQFDSTKAISILKYNPTNPDIIYAGFVGE